MEQERATELLARERARIERSLQDGGGFAPEDHPDTSDAADGAPDTLEAEIEAGLTETLRVQLDAVGRAEARLSEGTYGRSIESGEAIPDARLEAIPWAERTADEQSRHDA